MKIAKFIKEMYNNGSGQSLYELNPALSGYDYVVVSAKKVRYSGLETYIFGADKDGNILDWGELEGSFKGELCHKTALNNAGYKILYAYNNITTGILYTNGDEK